MARPFLGAVADCVVLDMFHESISELIVNRFVNIDSFEIETDLFNRKDLRKQIEGEWPIFRTCPEFKKAKNAT